MLPIEDYKQLEESLWQTARRFQALIENSNDMVVILDSNGIFRYASPSMTKILGYTPEQIIGQTFKQFTHPDDVAYVNNTLSKVIQSPGVELPEIEIQVRHQDETWRVLLATFTNLLENEAVNGLLVNCYDITQRKYAEEALKKSKKRLHQFITSISDHIYVTEIYSDGYHVNRYISPNVVDFTGHPIDNFMADRYFWPSTIIHPDDRAAAAIQAAYLDMGRDSEIEYRLVHANGTVIWVRDSAKVYLENTHKIIYGVVSNITERKQLEAQLLQVQKLDAISRLAGGIAHDFNNLLTVIIGNCQLILDELAPNNPHKEFIEHIYNAGNRAAALTNQLLTFSRQQVHQPQPLDLNALVSSMDYTIRRLLGADIDLVTILEPDLGQVSADPEQIERVIINLVLNARDAMPKGGELTLETANKYLDQTFISHYVGLKPGRYVMLAVNDIGQGMDETTQTHIFEPYFTTKNQDSGLGLGLATVHGIIKQNGGYIWVESSPRQGTRFKIYLPKMEDQFLTDTQGFHFANALRRGATILLVASENAINEPVHRAFINAGYIVLKARNGQEALQVYKNYSGSIDLLIIELTDSWEKIELQLAEHLQTLHPEMRVLMLTEDSHNALSPYTLKAELLKQPFNLDILINKVKEVLSAEL